MNNYENISDFEINKAVAEALGLPLAFTMQNHNNAVRIDTGRDCRYYERYEHKDYCNNPSDAWPIIIDNGIALTPIIVQESYGFSHFDKLWDAESMIGKPPFFNSEHKNPLRAAMIVFITMKGKQNDG